MARDGWKPQSRVSGLLVSEAGPWTLRGFWLSVVLVKQIFVCL